MPHPHFDPGRPTNGAATAALITGVLGLCVCPVGLVAVIAGAVGVVRGRQVGVGTGRAVAGLLLGLAGLTLGVALILALEAAAQVATLAVVGFVGVVAAMPLAFLNSAVAPVGVAALDYEWDHRALPVPGNPPPEGDPRGGLKPAARLSWRADLLPYLGERPLHARLDFAQPWDGPANAPASATPLIQFADPTDGPVTTATRMRQFVGPGTLADLGGNPAAITDGTSNTLLFVEATATVPWAANRELPYTPGVGAGQLGHPTRPLFWAAMADGSVRWVRKGVSPAALDAAVTPGGGEVLGLD